MSEPLTLAFLGCGRITAKHAGVLRKVPGTRCRYASRNAGRAAEFNRQLGGSGSYGSYQAAIDDESVDAIVVATPPDTHLELALAALGAGRHAVIEKPAFMHSSDVDMVAAAATSAGRAALVAENYRYRPLLGMLRDMLTERAVGDLRLIQIDAVKHQAAPAWLDHTMPGALWEGGIHWIHFLASLGPEITSISGLRPGNAADPERTMLVAATFADGAVGTLAYSWEVPSPLRGLRMSHIYGTRGVIGFETNGLFLRQNGSRSRIRFPGFRDISGYRAMWLDFAAAIRGELQPSMTLDLARRDLALVEQCYRSAAQAAPTENR